MICEIEGRVLGGMQFGDVWGADLIEVLGTAQHILQDRRQLGTMQFGVRCRLGCCLRRCKRIFASDGQVLGCMQCVSLFGFLFGSLGARKPKPRLGSIWEGIKGWPQTWWSSFWFPSKTTSNTSTLKTQTHTPTQRAHASLRQAYIQIGGLPS